MYSDIQSVSYLTTYYLQQGGRKFGHKNNAHLLVAGANGKKQAIRLYIIFDFPILIELDENLLAGYKAFPVKNDRPVFFLP